MHTEREAKLTISCPCGRPTEIVARPAQSQEPATQKNYEWITESHGLLTRNILMVEGGTETVPAMVFISLPPGRWEWRPTDKREFFYWIVNSLNSMDLDELQEVAGLAREINNRPPFPD